ncbi:threonine--tRNA ligase [Halothermothrix orenii]|uniref:Threonine--tRNA ligase n=1 Tax=Halothermothrix orenii (strain H 168 / OCM 544 / DSM 9562) TaxID=373903 RepID=B8D288_HALOH|nr:threonine--tRNA ligase [Halothermothrix orenii]ACL69315.1 Threonyl-tRNA synthetase [Halothermothrix orenii H 168]
MEKIKVTLPDGSVREYDPGVTIEEVAYSIGKGLGRAAVAGNVDDKLVDLDTTLVNDARISIVTIDSEEGLDIYRHTTAHILAQAVKRLYKNVKLGIGPTIENGFYYDFDVEESFSPSDLEKIEKEMEKIIKEDLPIKKEMVSRDEALKLMKEKGEIYKVELIEELEDDYVSLYHQGEFIDLCRGPHLPSTGKVKAFKLLNAAGAYWRGDENNKMLQRIYGTAFQKKKQLEEHLKMLEEAKKRDHNKLGRELDLFMTEESIGQGLPLLKPKGAKVVQILQRFVEDEEEKRGYQLTKTPYMAKSDLYKISGHWDHYKEDMFILGDEEKDDEVLALRPMTCPFQFMIYNSKLRSYRDLPLRYSETSTLFRNEASGEMHGLIRVRQFTISEGHIICTPEQLEEEFRGVVNLINYMMETLGIEDDIWYRFSKWDPDNREKYIDNPTAWEESQDKMKNILDKLNIDYVEAEGEAAFYGPKLDIQFRNVHGKEDTIITVQIDFALPERFDMTYIDKDNKKKRPYVIHRTSVGCYERTLAMLIEKYAGAFPTWLAPVQVEIIPVSDDQVDYAYEVKGILKEAGIRVEVDDTNEKLGYKIRQAQMEKIPYMLIVGNREVENRTVSVRDRKEGDLGAISIKEFKEKIVREVEEKSH